MAESTANDQPTFPNEGSERYRDLEEVLSEILDEQLVEAGPANRLELWLLPSGDCTGRVWYLGQEDPEVIFIPGT